jgi:RNA polymerase sigma-70 factor, ECF subfamily
MQASLAVEGLLVGAFAVSTMEDDPVEAGAVERARNGDNDAFDLLVGRWSRRVVSLAWTITGSADAAEEIAQETFVRAWERIGRFRSGSPFGPWILRIATNLAIDHLRHQKRFQTFEMDVEGLRTDSPDVRAEASESAVRIGKAIAALPEMQRVVAQLFLVEEYDHEEIAAMTGLSRGTVRSHLSIARSKLRDALGGSK